MELLVFQGLIAAHLVAGSTGAVAFWVPVIGRKGGRAHKRWGRVFTNAVSVYTAFMAFGSVRVFPALALHPAMWAIPLVTGLGILPYHRRVVDLQQRARAAPARQVPSAAAVLD